MADADASQSGAHLRPNRRLIVTRSLLAAAAGILPVPILDDVLASFVRARMLRAIAERRQVDVTGEALLVLSDEPRVSRLKHMTLTGLTLIALRRAWRKLFLLLAVGRRSDEFMHCFELGTLFDHYCARHHVGAALDASEAQKLRAAMEAVGTRARRDALVSALRAAGRRLGFAPARAEMRVLAPAGGPPGETLLAKASRVLEEELDVAGAGYVQSLAGAFDGAWRPT